MNPKYTTESGKITESKDIIKSLAMAFNSRPNKLTDADKKNLKDLVFLSIDDSRLYTAKCCAKCILELIKRNESYAFLIDRMRTALSAMIVGSHNTLADARRPYDQFQYGGNNER